MSSFTDWMARYTSNMKSLKDTLEYRMSWLEKYNEKIDAASNGNSTNGDPSASAGGAAYSASGMDPEKLRDMSLRGSSGLTVEQIDAWINSKAPKSSIMIGLGSAFIEAEKLSGNRADAILAHAAHESGWGTSNIVKSKYNWYGIGAFDSSPYASAHNFTGAAAGIINGAAWIADNYSKKGQDTYRKMRWNNGSHQYATDPEWDIKICKIWSTAPASSIGSAAGATASDVNTSGYFTLSGGHITPPGTAAQRKSYNSNLSNQTVANKGADLVPLPSDKFTYVGGSSDGKGMVNKYYLNALLLIYNAMQKNGMLVGNKMKVNSAYRFKDPDTGAMPDPGAHGWGGACDIGTSSLKQSVQLADICWGLGFRAIGVSKTFVHVDVGPYGIWSYGYGKYNGPGSINA